MQAKKRRGDLKEWHFPGTCLEAVTQTATCQDSQPINRDSNHAVPEYKSKACRLNELHRCQTDIRWNAWIGQLYSTY